jgi:hypothetical protein
MQIRVLVVYFIPLSENARKWHNSVINKVQL